MRKEPNAVKQDPRHQSDLVNQVCGVLLVAVALLMVVSLVSHSPHDPPNSSRSPELTENMAGWIGSQISYYLLFAVGHGAFVLVAIVLMWGWNRFRDLPALPLVSRSLALLAMVVVLFRCDVRAFARGNPSVVPDGRVAGSYPGVQDPGSLSGLCRVVYSVERPVSGVSHDSDPSAFFPDSGFAGVRRRAIQTGMTGWRARRRLARRQRKERRETERTEPSQLKDAEEAASEPNRNRFSIPTTTPPEPFPLYEDEADEPEEGPAVSLDPASLPTAWRYPGRPDRSRRRKSGAARMCSTGCRTWRR